MNKLIKILIASFVLWFAVTLYFYCQHFIFVKRHIVNEEIVFKDATVVVNEIILENSRRKHWDHGKRLWVFNTVKYFPPKLQLPFLQVCDLYSKPYERTAFWSVRIKGFIITRGSQTNLDSFLSKFYISDDTGSFYNGSLRTAHGDFSNMYCYEKEGRFYPNGGSSLKFVIEDPENKEVKWLTITPQWKTHMYSFIYKRPSQIMCNPEETIDKLTIPANDLTP